MPIISLFKKKIYMVLKTDLILNFKCVFTVILLLNLFQKVQ